jgi:bifunctional non-homologous end joining protein LigD
MNPEQISLYYRDGSSDKVYHAQLKESEDGWVVNFQYGRRGSTLQTNTKTTTPVAYDRAKKIYDKLVAEKTAKGYTPGEDGTPYQGTARASQVTDLVPQLLNIIDEERLKELGVDDAWMMQEKIDGVRLMIRKQGDEVTGSNRKGLVVAMSMAIEARLKTIDYDNLVLDGEAVGDVYWVFDMLEAAGDDLREESAESRYFKLAEVLDIFDNVESAVRLVPAAMYTNDKRALYKQLRDARAEGVVFKHKAAPYRPGRPASNGNQLKFKFTQTCTCRVVRLNPGKRSVQFMVRNGNGFAEAGNVTIPVNFEVPAVSDLIEVRYLYAYPGGSLYQPVYLGVRTDLDDADDLSTLKFKQGTTDDEEA